MATLFTTDSVSENNYIKVNDGSSTRGWATYQQPSAVTFQDSGDTVTLNNHGFVAGNTVSFTSITSTTGITTGVSYYVVNPTLNTFKLSASLGGSVLPLTTNGSGVLALNIPFQGTGGSPSVTFAVSTDSSMRGTSNFLFAHDNVNRQGQGFSYLCSIDPSDRGKVIRFNFEYLVASGTYADGDLTVWFYDVTNGQVIQGAPTSILNSSLIERYQSEVQVPITCAQMRVIVHVTTTTATAYTMRFENFSFGPSEKLYSGIQTDWVSYTPTITGLGTTNFTSGYSFWRRVGDSIEIQTRFNTGSSHTAVGVTFTLPNNLTADNIKMGGTTGQVGFGVAQLGTTDTSFGILAIANSNTLGLGGSASNGSQLSIALGTAFTVSNNISFTAKIPITGWSSSSQVVSDDYTGRIVAASGYANVSTGSGNPVTNWIKTQDTVGMFNYSTGIGTIKTSGLYRLSATVVQNVGNAAGVMTIQIYKGSTVITGSNGYSNGFTNGGASASVIQPFSVGETFKFSTNGGYAIDSANFHVELLQGPSQVLASEKIVLRVGGSTSTVTNTSDTDIVYNTKMIDTHGSYNLTTGEWTCNQTGFYEITATWTATLNSGGGGGVNANCLIKLFKNNVSTAIGYFVNQTASGTYRCHPVLNHLIQLNAGEVLKMKSQEQLQGGPVALINDSNSTFWEIKRV